MFKFTSSSLIGVFLGMVTAWFAVGDGRVADAQQGPSGTVASTPARGPGGYGRMYDPNTVETIAGKVAAVERVAAAGRASAGIHITVTTKDGPVDVRLGPAWYLDNQSTHIQRDDQVQVTGSRIELQGQSVLVASKVTRGNDVLVLRNESGVPVWSGWRRGMGSTTRPAGPMGRGMGRQMGYGRGMMGGGPMGPMPAAGQLRGSAQLAQDDPGFLLANREHLKLTNEQVRKLEAIQAEARAKANAVLTPAQQKLQEPAD